MRWPRLTQIGGGVKQAAMLGEGEAVGHAGDEIRDVAPIGARVAGQRGLAPFRRQRRRVGAIALEQVSHDALGLGHDANDALMPVDAGGEKGAQGIEVAAHRFGERDDGVRRVAHIVGADRGEALEAAARVSATASSIMRADQAANGFVEERACRRCRDRLAALRARARPAIGTSASSAKVKKPAR